MDALVKAVVLAEECAGRRKRPRPDTSLADSHGAALGCVELLCRTLQGSWAGHASGVADHRPSRDTPDTGGEGTEVVPRVPEAIDLDIVETVAAAESVAGRVEQGGDPACRVLVPDGLPLRLPLQRPGGSSDSELLMHLHRLSSDPRTRRWLVMPLLHRIATREKRLAAAAAAAATGRQSLQARSRPDTAALEEDPVGSPESEAASAMIALVLRHFSACAIEVSLTSEVKGWRGRNAMAIPRLFSTLDVGRTWVGRRTSNVAGACNGAGRAFDDDIDALRWMHEECKSFGPFAALVSVVLHHAFHELEGVVERWLKVAGSASSRHARFRFVISLRTSLFRAARDALHRLAALNLVDEKTLVETRWLYIMASLLASRLDILAVSEVPSSVFPYWWAAASPAQSTRKEVMGYALDLLLHALQRLLCRTLFPLTSAGEAASTGTLIGADAALAGDLFLLRDVFWNAPSAAQLGRQPLGVAGHDLPFNARAPSGSGFCASPKQMLLRNLSSPCLHDVLSACSCSDSETLALKGSDEVTRCKCPQKQPELRVEVVRFVQQVVQHMAQEDDALSAVALQAMQELSQTRPVVEDSGVDESLLGDGTVPTVGTQHRERLHHLYKQFSALHAAATWARGSRDAHGAKAARNGIEVEVAEVMEDPTGIQSDAGDAPFSAAGEVDNAWTFGSWLAECFYSVFSPQCFPLLSMERQHRLLEQLQVLAKLMVPCHAVIVVGALDHPREHVGDDLTGVLSVVRLRVADRGHLSVTSGRTLPMSCFAAGAVRDAVRHARCALPVGLELQDSLLDRCGQVLWQHQEWQRLHLKQVLRSDLRCMMCLYHSVLIILERAGRILDDAQSILWELILPCLAELSVPIAMAPDAPGATQGAHSGSPPVASLGGDTIAAAAQVRDDSRSANATLRSLAVLVSSGVLQLSWDLQGTAVVMERYAHGHTEMVLAMRRAWEKGCRETLGAREAVLLPLWDGQTEAYLGSQAATPDLLRAATGAGDLTAGPGGDDQLLEAMINQNAPLRLSPPSSMLVLLSFVRLLLERMKRARVLWEERIARELAVLQSPGEGGVYQTLRGFQVLRNQSFCAARDIALFRVYVALAHRMLFTFSLANLSLLPLWFSYLFHLFTVVVPPPDEEFDEEEIERVPGSAIALERIRRAQRERREGHTAGPTPGVSGKSLDADGGDPASSQPLPHLWQYFRKGPNVTAQGELRIALGELLADLVVAAQVDTPPMDRINRYHASMQPLQGVEGGAIHDVDGMAPYSPQEWALQQQALPRTVLAHLCILLGEQPASSEVAESTPQGDVQKEQQRCGRTFLGTVGLLALCRRLNEHIKPGSITSPLITQYLTALWRCTNRAVSGGDDV